ncbi:hypothetical protein GCM10025787_02670 [Saccharopolyspora rosea]
MSRSSPPTTSWLAAAAPYPAAPWAAAPIVAPAACPARVPMASCAALLRVPRSAARPSACVPLCTTPPPTPPNALLTAAAPMLWVSHSVRCPPLSWAPWTATSVPVPSTSPIATLVTTFLETLATTPRMIAPIATRAVATTPPVMAPPMIGMNVANSDAATKPSWTPMLILAFWMSAAVLRAWSDSCWAVCLSCSRLSMTLLSA